MGQADHVGLHTAGLVYPRGQVAPGQALTLGVDFSQRIRTEDGWYVLEILLPEGSEYRGLYQRLGNRFVSASTGLPYLLSAERFETLAPVDAGIHRMTVRVWYSDTESHLWEKLREPGSSLEDYLVAEETIPIEVSTSLDNAAGDLRSWVAARLLPAEWDGGYSQGGGQASYGATVEIADTEGPTEAAGVVEVLVDEKDRHQMGRFTLSQTLSGASHRWVGVAGGYAEDSGSGGEQSRAKIEFGIDGRYAFVGNRARYFIVFDRLSLPDGRTLGDGAKMEVEIWPDPLRAGPTRW